MRALFIIAKILLIVGGLNWGLVGLFNFNLVDSIFGEGSIGSQVVYVLVGLAALLTIIDLFVARYAKPQTTTRDERRVSDPMVRP